jgi:hypothetical protein
MSWTTRGAAPFIYPLVLVINSNGALNRIAPACLPRRIHQHGVSSDDARSPLLLGTGSLAATCSADCSSAPVFRWAGVRVLLGAMLIGTGSAALPDTLAAHSMIC